MIVSVFWFAPVGVVKRIVWLESVLTFTEDIVSDNADSDAAYATCKFANENTAPVATIVTKLIIFDKTVFCLCIQDNY
jgi:hypothetical protein